MKEGATPTDVQIEVGGRTFAAKHWHCDRLGERRSATASAPVPVMC
jgi:hypothetical protein